MTDDIDIVNRRQDRIEQAIEKLTNISNDLNKIIAVQDIRLTQQEKKSSEINRSIEKRREQLDDVIKDLQNDFYTQQNNTNQKISQLEKFTWMAIGGGIALSWVITYAAKYVFKIT
jgi:predicted  nucleic acid-binding Zn-ribbon protein